MSTPRDLRDVGTGVRQLLRDVLGPPGGPALSAEDAAARLDADYERIVDVAFLHQCSAYCKEARPQKKAAAADDDGDDDDDDEVDGAAAKGVVAFLCRMCFGGTEGTKGLEAKWATGRECRDSPKFARNRGKWSLELARDHPVLVQHIRLLVQAWRANEDSSFVVDGGIAGIIMYLTSYMCKGNKASSCLDSPRDCAATPDGAAVNLASIAAKGALEAVAASAGDAVAERRRQRARARHARQEAREAALRASGATKTGSSDGFSSGSSSSDSDDDDAARAARRNLGPEDAAFRRAMAQAGAGCDDAGDYAVDGEPLVARLLAAGVPLATGPAGPPLPPGTTREDIEVLRAACKESADQAADEGSGTLDAAGAHLLQGRQRLPVVMLLDWLLGDAESPPRLLVTGVGGAGKSHVLKALRRIVARYGKRHVTLAYMGSAARNCGGLTLDGVWPSGDMPSAHHTCADNPLKREKLQRLMRMYGPDIGVELIDEAFMIGTSKYLWRQHREAQVAAKFDAEAGGDYETSLVAHKAQDHPLAGRFAKFTFGDAGQLPPVLDGNPAAPDAPDDSGPAALGKRCFRSSFDEVLALNVNMRAEASAIRWVRFLQRMRRARAPRLDQDLNGRALNRLPPAEQSVFRGAARLCPRNKSCMRENIEHAKATGKSARVLVATWHGRHAKPGETFQLVAETFICIGMLMAICVNFGEFGPGILVNGMRGRVVSWLLDAAGEVEYVVLDIPDYTGPRLYPGDDPRHATWVPVPKMERKCSKKCCARTGFPLVPAHAATTHKWQGLGAGPGQPVKHITVFFPTKEDGKNFWPPRPAVPYVMCSRAASLDAIAIAEAQDASFFADMAASAAAIAVRELDEDYARRSNDLCARYAHRLEDNSYHALLARFDVRCDDGIRDAGELRDLRVAALAFKVRYNKAHCDYFRDDPDRVEDGDDPEAYAADLATAIAELAELGVNAAADLGVDSGRRRCRRPRRGCRPGAAPPAPPPPRRGRRAGRRSRSARRSASARRRHGRRRAAAKRTDKEGRTPFRVPELDASMDVDVEQARLKRGRDDAGRPPPAAAVTDSLAGRLALADASKQALSSSQLRRVARAIKDPDTQKVIKEKFDFEIMVYMAKRLADIVDDDANPRANYLVDELINYYLKMLEQRHNDLVAREGEMPCYFFNSFFIPKLLGTDAQSYDYAGVKRWTKKFDLFSCKRVFFPVNIVDTHWTLVMADLERKELAYFDGYGDDGESYLRGIRQYLRDEHEAEKGVPLSDEFTFVDTLSVTPVQRDANSCGVFVAFYANYLSLGLPLNFSQADIPHLRQRMMSDILDGSLATPR
ncbi:hypothetical protein JL721_4835 [Aureococcus anophagefferens]|nr:hypothetical protein JL721_4835 [Aureococcus anophagefferens]